MPQSSASWAISSQLRCSGAQPVRIFRVTGTSTALTTSVRIDLTTSGYCKRAEPASLRFTFLAGQPILISIIWAPLSTLIRAASAISFGSLPAICTVRIPGSSMCTIRKRDLSLSQTCGLEDIISDTVNPAPIS